MAESYAGITVPEGEPETIRGAAQCFTGVAGGLHGASADLQSVPGLVSEWKGPASAAFGGTAITNGSAVNGGSEAMAACAQAANTFAEELEQAQKDARQAITDARDAQGRIDDANADIEAALGAQTQASNDITSAESRIATSIGVPDMGAVADRDAASTALANAQDAEAAARRRLQQAQDDLEDAQERGNQAEQDAKRAARTAAGAFEGVAGHTPAAAMFGGSPHAIENTVLARVRAGDYSVLDEVAFNYLPEDTQKAIAAEIADESLKSVYGDGSHSLQEMSDVVDNFDHDDEFAVGFYNELGGDGARELGGSIIMFNNPGDGIDNPEVMALMAPFATLLGTATRSPDLRSDFTDDYIGDGSIRDRIPGHDHMVAFLMAGSAAGYAPKFLSRVGEEVLIETQDAEDAPPFMELSDQQDFMKFIADNPEAAGDLLAGTHGDGLSNVGPLLIYGPRYTDDGEALGALIQAGTHDLRTTDLALANDASHAVIQGVPTYMDGLGDKAKPALTTILDDHIEDFEYVAMERAEPGLMAAPDGGISGLTYEQGQDYLQALVGDDATRTDATTIVGDRVGYDIYQSAALHDTGYANRAGALSEMGVLATAEANLDDAQAQDAMNNLAKTASGKLIGLTPPGKVPGFDIISGKALDEIFSTDAVKHALEDQTAAQVDAFSGVKQLSIAAQVQLGQLPPEAMQTIHSDGTLNVNFIDGPNYDQDVIKVDTNGDGTPDRNLEWDLNHDGEISADEREITERDLYDAGLGNAEAASDGITSLYDVQYEGKHPPDIDDLELPDGLDNDNPSTFEKVWDWPFDAPGEGTIADDSGVVAHQDDLHYDTTEKVYNLDVEGHDQLHYQRIDGEWKLVEKVGDEWQPVK